MDLGVFGVLFLVIGFILFVLFANPVAPMNYIIGIFLGSGMTISAIIVFFYNDEKKVTVLTK